MVTLQLVQARLSEATEQLNDATRILDRTIEDYHSHGSCRDWREMWDRQALIARAIAAYHTAAREYRAAVVAWEDYRMQRGGQK